MPHRSLVVQSTTHANAVMESFFSTVKSELPDRFESHGEATRQLFDYIEVFYNQRRRHSTLGQMSPSAFERQHGFGRDRSSIASERRDLFQRAVVANRGIVQVGSTGDRRSWGIL